MKIKIGDVVLEDKIEELEE